MSGSTIDYQKLLEEYEDKIIKFYVKSGKAKNFSDKFSTVFATFHCRRKLTQKQVQDLTGFSAGTISKIINQLLLLNMIEAHKQSGTRERIYEVKGFGPDFVVSASRLIGGYMDSYKKLLKRVQRRLKKMTREVSKLQDEIDIDDFYLFNPTNERILMFQNFFNNFTLVYTTLKNAAKTIEEVMGDIAAKRKN